MRFIRQPHLSCVLLLALAACGDDGSGSTSAKPTANIAGPASADERTAIVLNGQGSTAGTGSITSYAWALASSSVPNLSLANATQASATLNIGEIAEDTPITVNLTVTDSGGATSTTQYTVQAKELDRAKLPPNPSAAESKATLLGVDRDEDGVRDDIEHSIYGMYPLDSQRRQILLIGGKSIQMAIAAGSDAALGDAASEQEAVFAHCAVSLYQANVQGMSALIDTWAVNTPAREQAYLAYMRGRDGTIQRTLSDQEATCTFN